MTDPGQNGNYNPFPQPQAPQYNYGQQQQTPYGQQQAPQYNYGQQQQAPQYNYGPQQNAYNPYPQQQYGQQPQKEVPEEDAARTPVASIVFIFIAIFLLFIRYVANFANGGLTVINILYFLADIAACVLMILGLFMRKLRLLYGIGLFVLALLSFVALIQVLTGNGEASEGSMNFFLFSAYTLAGLYFVLKGRGIKKGLKLAACIIGLVFEMTIAIVLFVNVVNFIPAKSMGLFAVQVLMGMVAMMFIWIATMIFTPFGRKKR